MKLPSHLAKSRHGVFYFRLTIRRGTSTQEKRWSLKTRDPAAAKIKALHISAAIAGAKMKSGHPVNELGSTNLDHGPSGEKRLPSSVGTQQGDSNNNFHGLTEGAGMRQRLGVKFETLVAYYLKNDPTQKNRFSEVWHWASWPQSANLSNQRIDLVAQEKETGVLWAIHCKFNTNGRLVQKADIDALEIASSKEPFTFHMIATNTDFGNSAKVVMENLHPVVHGVQIRDLENSPIDWRHCGLNVGANADEPDPIAELVRALEIRIGSATIVADPNNQADLLAAQEMARTLMGAVGPKTPSLTNGLVGAQEQSVNSGADNKQRNLSGLTLDELITRYATRKRDTNGAKTNYEYEKMQRKFERWVHAKKKTKPYPVRLITRTDVSEFIDDLIADDISPQTIQKKYLSALNGLFTLAQTSGAIPAGELPTKNHKLFTKADKKKAQHRSGYKPFTDDELKLIFAPASLQELEKPCDFWLPLLGLFTGGRISELCQLKASDIKQVDGIWTIDINDEDAAQTLKTPAAMRKIPLPPQLIQIGFLDYLELVKPYNGTIFPYIEPDAFNHYGKTPGRRFGEYLDRLKITSPNKVFHSLRSTSNNRLKELGVGEETRCQFIGHEHDTVNSKVYSSAHSVRFLYENVSEKLTYPHLKLDTLIFPKIKQEQRLAAEMQKANRRRNIRAVRTARAERNGQSSA